MMLLKMIVVIIILMMMIIRVFKQPVDIFVKVGKCYNQEFCQLSVWRFKAQNVGGCIVYANEGCFVIKQRQGHHDLMCANQQLNGSLQEQSK